MAADPIIYCLEQLTDYDQFERLCHDLMARNGYAGIEPLGGSKDKGRDALHEGVGPGSEKTVFAYSVREDWRQKLGDDCSKIRGHNHACDRVAFLCTADFTATERDNAVQFVQESFGWKLDLYGLERLRILLAADQTAIAQHPQIFCPPFFPQAAGVSLTHARDHLVLDFADADEPLGTWLARRLLLAGYSVWARTIAPIAGSSISETIEALIEYRAFRFLPILSAHSAANPDFTARRSLAARTRTMLLPLSAGSFDPNLLDAKTRGIEAIRFDSGWAAGIAALISNLETSNCPVSGGGASLALRSFMPPNLIAQRPETIHSNRFTLTHVPLSINRYASDVPFPNDRFDEIRHRWAFRRVDPQKFLAFHAPPRELAEEFKIRASGGSAWQYVKEIDGISTSNLGPELIRKSIIVHLVQRGLVYCPDRKVIYFPGRLLPSERAYFPRPDGTRGFVTVTGRRKFYRPSNSTYYRYQLSPDISADKSAAGIYYVTIRVRVRVTDDDGHPYKGRTVNSRRKHLCKSWWNDEWFSRVLAVVHFLAENKEVVVIGDNDDSAITFAPSPDNWEVPVSIDESALSIEKAEASREDVLEHGYDDDDNDA